MPVKISDCIPHLNAACSGLRQLSHRTVGGCEPDGARRCSVDFTAPHVTYREVRRSDLVRQRAADSRACIVTVFPLKKDLVRPRKAPCFSRQRVELREKDLEGEKDIAVGTKAQVQADRESIGETVSLVFFFFAN